MPNNPKIDHDLIRLAGQYSARAYDRLPEIECVNTDTQAIIRRCSRFMFIAFRGTSNGKDVRQDLKRIQEENGHGDVHEGFLQCYLSIKQQLQAVLNSAKRKELKVIFTGHSLGGAIAQLAAVDHKASCIAFGSPKVGDQDFVQALEALDDLILYENHLDFISELPYFGYSKPKKNIIKLWSWPIFIGKRPSFHSIALYNRLIS